MNFLPKKCNKQNIFKLKKLKKFYKNLIVKSLDFKKKEAKKGNQY